MKLNEEEKIDYELLFIQYCYDNAVKISIPKTFLIHQRAFFFGVIKTLGLIHQEITGVDDWIETIVNKRLIIDKADFQQLTLEVVNDKSQAALLLLEIKRAKRRKNKELKRLKEMEGYF